MSLAIAAQLTEAWLGHLQQPGECCGALPQLSLGRDLRGLGHRERPFEQRPASQVHIIGPHLEELALAQLVGPHPAERQACVRPEGIGPQGSPPDAVG